MSYYMLLPVSKAQRCMVNSTILQIIPDLLSSGISNWVSRLMQPLNVVKSCATDNLMSKLSLMYPAACQHFLAQLHPPKRTGSYRIIQVYTGINLHLL